MTKEDLENECVKDSQHWTDTGSGNLGRLFVEILQCDDLPNLDTGAFAGNKTDAFVSLVFEDTATVTDVIDDTLSPRWMPWTKRAFIRRWRRRLSGRCRERILSNDRAITMRLTRTPFVVVIATYVAIERNR